jgi:outer membrane protein TolC
LGTVSLPVWQDKLQAETASAQAGQQAAAARLAGAQINLMMTFAEKSYDYRQVTHNLTVLEQQLIPKTQRSLEIARSAYLDGKTDFFNLMDTERSLLNEESDLIAARLQRELVLAEISLLIAGVPPGPTALIPEHHLH